jgi:lipopolysaccharide/colanic/teichoic acid biosynthesis glycosyltransferase
VVSPNIVAVCCELVSKWYSLVIFWTIREMKRVFDIVLSAIAIVALIPVLALLALAIRARLGGPVLFTQVRPGLNGKPFILIKFRTMTDEKDTDGALLPDSARLPKFGLFLRSTSLDELPELWNVVKGDMSLVGPRPLLTEYLNLYSAEQARRHEVQPGITGWAQVNGRNALTWEEKFTLDVWYVDNQSIWLDLKILLMTLAKVFKREGVSHAGHATVEKFRGGAK